MKKSTYFISRNAWFYGTFAQCAWYVRYGVTLAIIGSTFLLWYMTSYHMLHTFHAAAVASLDKLAQDTKSFKDTQQKMEDLGAVVARLQAQYQGEISALQDIKVDAKNLMALIKQHAVTLQLYAPQEAVIMPQGYVKQTLRIDIVGSYENIVACMQAIIALSPSLLFSYVHCEKYQDKVLASLHISWYEVPQHIKDSDEKIS